MDEFVVNVGHSEDNTLQLVRSIDSRKVRIIETKWDENLRTDGKIFGMQQDIALSHCTGDWALLVQGDEVLHEEDYDEIRNALKRYLEYPAVAAEIAYVYNDGYIINVNGDILKYRNRRTRDKKERDNIYRVLSLGQDISWHGALSSEKPHSRRCKASMNV